MSNSRYTIAHLALLIYSAGLIYDDTLTSTKVLHSCYTVAHLSSVTYSTRLIRWQTCCNWYTQLGVHVYIYCTLVAICVRNSGDTMSNLPTLRHLNLTIRCHICHHLIGIKLGFYDVPLTITKINTFTSF